MNRQRYDCPDCEASKWLPEHPRHGPLTVRTGCRECGRIKRHKAAGRFVPRFMWRGGEGRV